MWADLPIFGDYNKRPTIFNAEDVVNLFLIEDPAGKKRQAYLATPGLKQEAVVDPTSHESRNLFAFNNQEMFGVFGDSVVKTNSLLISNEIGTVSTIQGPISIASNNADQLLFADGVNAHCYDTRTGTYSLVANLTAPLNAVFLDGYFVAPLANSNMFQISAPNDGTSWDVLDAAQINAYPGNNVGVGVVNRRLYFFKDTSTEVWYNIGASDLPFRRDNNLLFNYGCLTRASIASDYGYLFWLARDKSGVGSVMMTRGDVPEVISDYSIDNLISSFSRPDDLSTWIYKDSGHVFYVMNWKTDDFTLSYDVTSNNWNRLEMLPEYPGRSAPINKTRHLGNCHAFFNGNHYVGSYKNPILYNFSRDFVDNAGEPIRRARVSKHFFDPAYRMIQMDHIQLDMQMGLGRNSGIYSNPQAYLSISRDGGLSFGNRRPAPIGKIGNRKCRAIFRRLGLARDIVCKFEIFSSLPDISILGASINYEVLDK